MRRGNGEEGWGVVVVNGDKGEKGKGKGIGTFLKAVKLTWVVPGNTLWWWVLNICFSSA